MVSEPHQQQQWQRVPQLDQQFTALNINSPQKQAPNLLNLDDQLHNELLTQDSTPEKDNFDKSDGSLNKYQSSIYGSEAQLQPAFSQSASSSRLNGQFVEEFDANYHDKEQFFNNSSCPSKMSHAYPPAAALATPDLNDQIDQIFSPHDLNPVDPFFSSEFDAERPGQRQQPSQIMDREQELAGSFNSNSGLAGYEMVKNKGVTKRQKRSRQESRRNDVGHSPSSSSHIQMHAYDHMN